MSHCATGLLNEEAWKNNRVMSSTAEVFQLLMYWLNDVADRNIPYILVTCAVFQLPIF